MPDSFAQSCPPDPNDNLPFTCDVAPVRINTFAPAGTGLYTQLWSRGNAQGGNGGAGTADPASRWQTAFNGGPGACNGLPTHANAPNTILPAAPTLGVDDQEAPYAGTLSTGPGTTNKDNAQQDGWLLVPVGQEMVNFIIGGPFADANALYAGTDCSDLALVGEVNTNDGNGDATIEVCYTVPAGLPIITSTQNGCEFQLLRVRLYHYDFNAFGNSIVRADVTGQLEQVPTGYLLPAMNADDDVQPTMLDDAADETLYALIDENGTFWEPNGDNVPTTRVNAGSGCLTITDIDDCVGQPAPTSGPSCADALAADPCQIDLLDFGCDCNDPDNTFGTPGDPTSVTAYSNRVVVTSGLFDGSDISVTNVVGATDVTVIPTPNGEGVAVITFMAAPSTPYSFDVNGSDGRNGTHSERWLRRYG